MLDCFTSLMHLLWGLLILINHDSIHIAATRVMVHLFPQFEVRAFLYIISALLPLFILRYPGSVIGILSVLPQQLILIMSGISAITAITQGQYADGTIRSPLFIAADQGIYVLLAILYAFESLDRFHERS